MAKPSLTTIATTQTFQNWLDKTNELVSVFQDDAITASAGGDITTGNASLQGNFEAFNLLATTKLSSASIGHYSAGSTITFVDPISVTGSSQTVATFTFPSQGAQTQYTNGSITWDVGMKDSGGAFIMNTGGGGDEFSLSTAGTLSVANINVSQDIIVTEDITCDNLTVNGDLTFSGALGGVTTAAVTEDPSATYSSGTQYFTRARVAASLSEGTGIDFSTGGNGEVIITANMTEIATGINLSNYIQSSTTQAFTNVDASGYVEADNIRLSDGSFDINNRVYISGVTQFSFITGRLNIVNGGATHTPLSWTLNGIGITGNISQNTSGVDNVFRGSVDIGAGAGTINLQEAGNILCDGYIRADGDITAFYSASDIKLKENIKVIQAPLEKISQISGYTFNYKEKPDYETTGLIAQEVEKVLPGVVYDVEDEGDTYKAIRYGNVVGLLVEAIKELQDRIVELENKCSCTRAEN